MEIQKSTVWFAHPLFRPGRNRWGARLAIFFLAPSLRQPACCMLSTVIVRPSKHGRWSRWYSMNAVRYLEVWCITARKVRSSGRMSSWPAEHRDVRLHVSRMCIVCKVHVSHMRIWCKSHVNCVWITWQYQRVACESKYLLWRDWQRHQHQQPPLTWRQHWRQQDLSACSW